MIVTILGPGCANCRRLESNTREAIADLGLDATVEKVQDYPTIASYGVMSTPRSGRGRQGPRLRPRPPARRSRTAPHRRSRRLSRRRDHGPPRAGRDPSCPPRGGRAGHRRPAVRSLGDPAPAGRPRRLRRRDVGRAGRRPRPGVGRGPHPDRRHLPWAGGGRRGRRWVHRTPTATAPASSPTTSWWSTPRRWPWSSAGSSVVTPRWPPSPRPPSGCCGRSTSTSATRWTR